MLSFLTVVSKETHSHPNRVCAEIIITTNKRKEIGQLNCRVSISIGVSLALWSKQSSLHVVLPRQPLWHRRMVRAEVSSCRSHPVGVQQLPVEHFPVS